MDYQIGRVQDGEAKDLLKHLSLGYFSSMSPDPGSGFPLKFTEYFQSFTFSSPLRNGAQ